MLCSGIKVSSAIVLVAVAGAGVGLGPVRATDPVGRQGAGQAEKVGLQETLLKLEKAGYDALKGMDREASFALLAPDFVAILAGEGRLNRDEFVKELAKVTVTEYALSDMALVQPNPDSAILAYRAKTSFTYKGKPTRETLWVSSTWARRGEKWLNVFYQETEDD